MFKKKIAFLELIVVFLLSLFLQYNSFGQESKKNFAPKPAPNWIKKYPKAKLKKGFDYKSDLILIHHEVQYNHEVGETYNRFFYYLRTIEGLNQIKSFYFDYAPDYEEVFVNDINIYRNNKKIALNTQLQIENEIKEKQIGGEGYDIDGKLSIYFDRTKAGDIIEITYTKKGFQPDLHGVLLSGTLKVNELRGKRFLRISSAKNKPLKHKSFNSSKKPRITKSNGITTLELITDQYKKQLETQTPSWYDTSTLLEVNDFTSLKEYLDLNLKNFDLDEEPSLEIRAKVKKLIRQHPTKEAQINAILNYIQGEIKYLDYEKMEPKPPGNVLRQGFGDCKSMTLLTIKMLEVIGVQSWPVIVNINGLDERWNNIHFVNNVDHAVLEFVYKNDTLVFDATRDFQKGSIYQKYHNDFKYGFRVKEGNDKLNPLNHNYYSHTITEATIVATGTTKAEYNSSNVNLEKGATTIVATETSEAEYNSLNLIFEGDVANKMNHLFHEYGIQKVYKSVYRYLPTDFAFDFNEKDLVLNYESQDNAPKSVLKIQPQKPSKSLFSSSFYGDDPGVFIPQGISKNLGILVSDKLGAYFSLPNFDEITETYKFIHPRADSIKEDSVQLKNDWIHFSKKIERIRDTLTVKYHIKILKSDLGSSRYTEVSKEINRINKKLLPIVFNKSERRLNQDYIVLEERNSNTPLYLFITAILMLGGFLGLFIGYFLRRKRNQKFKKDESL